MVISLIVEVTLEAQELSVTLSAPSCAKMCSNRYPPYRKKGAVTSHCTPTPLCLEALAKEIEGQGERLFVKIWFLFSRTRNIEYSCNMSEVGVKETERGLII